MFYETLQESSIQDYTRLENFFPFDFCSSAIYFEAPVIYYVYLTIDRNNILLFIVTSELSKTVK